MKRVISCDGAKGGVGKSTIAEAVIDCCIHHLGRKCLIIESDTSNPDVAKAHQHIPCVALDLNREGGFLDAANVIAQADADYIVISNRAASSGSWGEWGSILVDNQAEIGAGLTILWVIGRQRDSIEALKLFRAHSPQARIHPVLNGYFGDRGQFEIWNASKTRAAILENGGVEVFFPSMADRVTDHMRNARLCWSDGEKMPIGNRLELARVRKLAWAALAPIL